MTRTERLASFEELTKLPGIKRASVFADELANTARLKFDHPLAGRPWHIDGVTDVPGFYHLSVAVPIGLDYYQSRMDYARFELVLFETEFERIQ